MEDLEEPLLQSSSLNFNVDIEVLEKFENFILLTNVFWEEFLVFAPAGIWTRVPGSKGPYTCPGYTTGATSQFRSFYGIFYT